MCTGRTFQTPNSGLADLMELPNIFDTKEVGKIVKLGVISPVNINL